MIAHCCQFPRLSVCKKVNCEFNPVTFWYQTLGRHKASQHFYEVFNYFVFVFKELLFGKDAPRMSDQESKFLDRKGTLEQMKNYSVIRIFGSKENPSFLPCHISDKMFVVKIARRYNYWLHFFLEKRKKQFIPLPWKVGDFLFRNMSKIDEFMGHFHNLNLKYVEKVKGLDPSGIFVEHLLSVGFNNSFNNEILNEYRDNSSGTLAHDTDDLETILNTNESYKKRGKGLGEKSVQSSTVTPKSTTPRSSAPTAHQSKKVTHISSGDGGDKNPPSGKIEISHKIPLRKKRKSIVQKEEGHRGLSDIHDLSLEDIELEIEIEKVFRNVDQLENTAHQNPQMEIIETETFDEEESFVFQSVVFYSESKNLIIEKRDVKNKKGKSHSDINLRNMWPSQISKYTEQLDTL
jgi:hypothetical protein